MDVISLIERAKKHAHALVCVSGMGSVNLYTSVYQVKGNYLILGVIFIMRVIFGITLSHNEKVAFMNVPEAKHKKSNWTVNGYPQLFVSSPCAPVQLLRKPSSGL